MTGGFSDRLSSILDEIDATIAECERSLASNVDVLHQLHEQVERERADIVSDLEQRQLERLVQSSADGDESEEARPRENELQKREEQLLATTTRVSSLHNQVSDFRHLLTATRRHLASEQALPGFDEAQKHALRQAMIRSKEEERRRLSREVHDGPAQVLANAIIGLEFIERALAQSEETASTPAVSEIHRIKSSMREGLSEIRRFIFDLRPNMLLQRGLIGTIEHYVQTYQSLLPDDLELSLPSTDMKMTDDQELTAFRVIQESLQNVHKHAGSSKCWVSIEAANSQTVVTVRDDGRGFEPEKVRTGVRSGSGILGMKERAETIGASLTIESAPRGGTEIRLEIPASAERAENPVRRASDRLGSS